MQTEEIIIIITEKEALTPKQPYIAPLLTMLTSLDIQFNPGGGATDGEGQTNS